MMLSKKICCVVYLTAILNNAFAQTVYYTPTMMPAALKNTYQGVFDMKSIAEDVAFLISSATGKKYETKVFNKQSKGIFLLLDSTFEHKSSEAGNIEFSADKIIIKAKYATGISYAVYSWLQKLGFQFSLPGNEWTIIPKISNLNLAEKSITLFPHFLLRTMYASGGMALIKGLDEERRNEKEWWLWYRRNRMGCDYYKIDGHIGELFNIVHEKEITSDPAILAPVNGKRIYSVGGKLDPTNKKGVALFSDWIVNEYRKEQKTLPSFLPHKKYYTVDPGDGLDYCHTPECEKQFASVSDQVFYIANETAKKIRSVDVRAGVSTMAYTERSDTPSIKIEPNVHVMIVPTAFQNVSTSTELMQRWSKKTKNISQYDFLNIGVWSLDQPFFDMKDYISRLNFLDKLQIQGMSFETSMSKFASGIQQYFILKFLCEPYSNPEKLLKEFCKINFGNAAPFIEKLFSEWYFSDVHIHTNRDRESFLPDELGRFLQYVHEAENTGINQTIKERIQQIKSYVVYLCEFYELFQSPEYKKQQSVKADEVMDYTWNLYSKNILHNSQLNDMLTSYVSDKKQWDYKNSAKFSSYKKTDVAKANSMFEKFAAKYPPVKYELQLSDSFFRSAVKYAADSISISSMDESAFGKFIYPVSFYAAASSTLKIKYVTGKGSTVNGKDKVAIIACESEDYTFIETKFIYQQNETGEITFKIPEKGKYHLLISYFNATPVQYVLYPNQQLFYLHKKSILNNAMSLQKEQRSFISTYGMPAFINPSDSIRLAFPYENTVLPVRLFSINGYQLDIVKNQFSFSAKPPKENRFIFYTNEVYRWPPVLINTPPYFFFLKNAKP